MNSDQAWWTFTPSGKRIFYTVFASAIVFSAGLYVVFRWLLNLEEFALPIASIFFIVDTLAAVFAARAITRAEQMAGTKR